MLGNMEPPIKTQEMIYKAVVQAVLLYSRKIWVVTDVMIMVLEGFHNSISRRIVGMLEWRRDSGEWEWALVDVALEVTGL